MEDEFGDKNWLPVFRPKTVDKMFRWDPGTAVRFVRQGLLSHVGTGGKIRFNEGSVLSTLRYYRTFVEDERFEEAFSAQEILEMALAAMARAERRKLEGNDTIECEGEE